MTERVHFHFSLSCTGEGNGNPLQCSCLENPRDGGAWWAAVYGVTESDTTEATQRQQQRIHVHLNLLTHPTLLPPDVHEFFLYISVSISALQIGPSVPFSQILYICINIGICSSLSDFTLYDNLSVHLHLRKWQFHSFALQFISPSSS